MTMKMVYWVNLSESSGAGSPGLSSINKWPLSGCCLPPTTDEVYVFARVRLSVCVQDYSETRAWIWMKCCVSTDVGTWTN